MPSNRNKFFFTNYHVDQHLKRPIYSSSLVQCLTAAFLIFSSCQECILYNVASAFSPISFMTFPSLPSSPCSEGRSSHGSVKKKKQHNRMDSSTSSRVFFARDFPFLNDNGYDNIRLIMFRTNLKKNLFIDDDDDDDLDDSGGESIDEDIESLWMLGEDDEDEDEDEEGRTSAVNDDDDDDGFKEIVFSLDINRVERNSAKQEEGPQDEKRIQKEDTKSKEITPENREKSQTRNQIEENIANVKSIQRVQPISSSSNLKAPEGSSDTDSNSQYPRPRGVGRQGYNITILHQINYDQTNYYEHFTKSSYDIRIDLLKDYHSIHGHINIPFRYSVEVNDYDTDGCVSGTYEIHLGRWLHWIRTLYKKDLTRNPTGTNSRQRVPIEYIEKLNELGMNWDGVGARRRPTNFDDKCNELLQFIEKYGHSYVPKDWAENKSLAMWVERQRFLYKRRQERREKGYQLTDERIELLRSIGFDFNGRSQGRSGILEGKFSSSNTPTSFSEQIQSGFDKDWFEKLDFLRSFKSIHGHCNIDLSSLQAMMSIEESWDLSFWFVQQIRQYALLYDHDWNPPRSYNDTTINFNIKSLLTPQRYQALSDIDFDFAARKDSLLLPWQDIANISFDCEKMISLLRKQKERMGTCIISLDENVMAQIALSDLDRSSSYYEHIMMFLFQKRIRWEKKHELIRSSISQIDWYLERQDVSIEEKLTEIGFSWFEFEIPDKDHTWEREFEWWGHFYDLCRYKKVNNSFDLNSNEVWYSEDLVDWLEEQKESFNILTNNGNYDGNNIYYFKEWHLQALYDAGFDFNIKDNVDESQQKLVNGPNKVGRPLAILALENDLESKYEYLSSDLQKVADDSLNRKRIDKAEQLAWLVRYEALRRLYSSHGPGALSILSTDKDACDHRLILWADNQRKQYANFMKGTKSALTKSRIKLLDEIGFDWELPSEDEEWNQMTFALKKFHEENGHCYIPAVYPKNMKLGRFVHMQRQQYQLMKRDDIVSELLPINMTNDRAIELTNIGLDLSIDNLSFGNFAYNTLWNCKIDELKVFKKLHGHCNIDFDYKSPYYDLALWVKEQRILYQRFREGIPSQLDETRIDELNDLGFVWEDKELKDA